jgi:hypothetical protein
MKLQSLATIILSTFLLSGCPKEQSPQTSVDQTVGMPDWQKTEPEGWYFPEALLQYVKKEGTYDPERPQNGHVLKFDIPVDAMPDYMIQSVGGKPNTHVTIYVMDSSMEIDGIGFNVKYVFARSPGASKENPASYGNFCSEDSVKGYGGCQGWGYQKADGYDRTNLHLPTDYVQRLEGLIKQKKLEIIKE